MGVYAGEGIDVHVHLENSRPEEATAAASQAGT